MSAVASKTIPSASSPKPAADPDPIPLLESEGDTHETTMAYDPSSSLPILVVLVWVVALGSLGLYAASFYFPDLAAWRAP